VKGLAESIGPMLYQREGPLTEELVRSPGRFGLGQVPGKLTPDDTTTMVCGFCSTGCGLKVHLKEGQAVNLTAETDYPVNLGMACPKGWEALTPLSSPDRALTPMLRNDETGVLKPIDWERALLLFCGRLKEIKAKHGPESCAFLSSGQIVTEEMAFLGALWKFGMGFIHCDSNTRQCMATSHIAYKQSFGFDAPPFTYADFEESDVLVFIGSNPCIAHPIMWQRVRRNRHNPEIIVIDPRKTETAMAATQYYAIKPKSDLVLLYGLANILASSGWIDPEYIQAHTTGYAEFQQFITQFTTDRVSAETGIEAQDLWRLAECIGEGKRVSFWWTMGVNQGHESTRTAQAIINLALMTGNIGRPGTGANSITGQCNAMGSRLYSNITSLIGGHDACNQMHRAKIANVLGISEEQIPVEQSLAYDQIVEGVRTERIKALWIVGTNPAHSWIQQRDFNQLLLKLDFLVVQDLYTATETAMRADLILPAAGWGEKEGTMINSERRIGLVKKVRRAPGQALADFHIFQLIAHYWGCGGMFSRWTSPEMVFQLLKEISREQPCDITGIADYAALDLSGGVQWPLSEGASDTRVERRLFENGHYFTPEGKARFVFDSPSPAPETPDSEYPFILLTGRGSSAQWHTGTRTNKSDILRKLSPDRTYVEINSDDAIRLGIQPGDDVSIESRRALITAKAFPTTTMQAGQVFIPMHYAEVNQLTHAAFDPHSRQPSYKASAVRLAKASRSKCRR
jgi:assimilatory nitrate reductase catalytic subunit